MSNSELCPECGQPDNCGDCNHNRIWIVEVPEVHYQLVEIEADSAEEALEAVRNGDGNYLDGALEFSHTLESSLDIAKVSEKESS